MNKQSDIGPRLTIEISEEEKRVAKEAKDQFKDVLKELKEAIKCVLDLRSAITEQHPTKEQLNDVYRGRLLRYRRKIINHFNVFLKHLQSNLVLIQKIDDPDMTRLREILVAEIGELTDGIDIILDLLQEPIKEDFTKNLEAICSQLEKRQNSIEDAIGNQLFNHLEHDLLGRMRISQLRFNIQKRSRLIIQAARMSRQEQDEEVELTETMLKAIERVKKFDDAGTFAGVPPGQKRGFTDWMQRKLMLNPDNRSDAGVISALLVLIGIMPERERWGDPAYYEKTLDTWRTV